MISMHNTAMMLPGADGAEPRPEVEQADHQRHDGGKKHGGGGEVLQLFDFGVFVGMREIGDVFDGGVEGFGHPDEAGGENHGNPFAAADFEPPTERDDDDGRNKMDAGMDFAFEQRRDPAEGAGEAVRFAREESAWGGHQGEI